MYIYFTVYGRTLINRPIASLRIHSFILRYNVLLSDSTNVRLQGKIENSWEKLLYQERNDNYIIFPINIVNHFWTELRKNYIRNCEHEKNNYQNHTFICQFINKQLVERRGTGEGGRNSAKDG